MASRFTKGEFTALALVPAALERGFTELEREPAELERERAEFEQGPTELDWAHTILSSVKSLWFKNPITFKKI
ncbi:hypothetical protein [Virgibacillus oceani]|uniref:Uncharacterized protein n=1 Tax=Virgibacillus oceani TaxID=1479511 RepID=A0A917M9P8_9BACI|nr:hypothetical protein [Virgibacillus oceani]GGG86610.1 hypothetical protein GCM10011398_35530 [Virgibacillus oceani]